MRAVLETTRWQDLDPEPNHVYLMDGTRAVAYIKWGRGEPYYFKQPIILDLRGRKFVELEDNPFAVKARSDLVAVKGSRGDTYYVDPAAGTCTCAGFTFRGHCRHIKEVC